MMIVKLKSIQKQSWCCALDSTIHHALSNSMLWLVHWHPVMIHHWFIQLLDVSTLYTFTDSYYNILIWTKHDYTRKAALLKCLVTLHSMASNGLSFMNFCENVTMWVLIIDCLTNLDWQTSVKCRFNFIIGDWHAL